MAICSPWKRQGKNTLGYNRDCRASGLSRESVVNVSQLITLDKERSEGDLCPLRRHRVAPGSRLRTGGPARKPNGPAGIA
jgi:hypothetical protein